jgi:beta-ureidopropionase
MRPATIHRSCRVCLLALLAMAAPGCGLRQTAGQDTRAADAGERPRTVRVAGIVLKWITADRERNCRRVEPLIRQAASRGAQLVITTECFLDGYAIRDKSIPIDRWRELGEEIPNGKYVRRLCRLADELNIHLVAGMVERVGRTTYNTVVLIGPDGRLIGKYHKQCLEHELVRNTPGHEFPVFDTPFGKAGLIICADRRDPEITRRLVAGGAELILCPSGGMWGPVKNDHYLQDRSRENRVPIVFVHPCEFLVTASDGSIIDRRFAGDQMSIAVDEIGGLADAQLVAVFDLGLPDRRGE